MILTWGQQARPVGLSTLEQVRALKEAAEGAAATAAADAVAAVQPTLDGAVEAAQEARDEAQDAAVAAAGASIASGSYDAEADALVLTRSSGVEITAPFNGVFTPSILHDYSHGIPLDKLAPAMSPFDKTGTDDVRSKFATGITSAAADGLPILIPVGATLKVTSTEPLVPPSNGIRILGNRGSNAARPVIIHDEASYYDRSNQTNYNNGYTDLFRLDGGGVLDIEGVTLRGSAYTDRSEGNLRLINAQQTHAGVRLRDVVLEYTRAVALWSVGATEIFDTDDTTTQYTIRGGWQVRDPMVPVRITRFRGRYTRDDALHINMVGSAQSGLTFPPGGQDVFVDDVNLFGCNGILFSGVKRGYLGRVRAKLCTNRLVKIGADHSYGAGDTSSLDIIVRDVIGEDLLAPQDAGSRHNWIELYMLRPDADGIPALPEYPDTNGDIVQPYGLYYGRDMTDAPGVPSIPGRGIVIDGFIGRRTLAATAAFTEYGHGMFFNRDGDTDPPITDDALMPDAMLITGGVKDLTVRNSEFEGLRDFVNWDLTNVPTGGVERVMFDQVKARDIRRDPVKFVSGGGNTQDITFRRCDIDGDPLCVHSSRAPAGDGSWQDTVTGCAFQVQNLYGVRLIENHVRNVPMLVSNLGNINESRGNVAYGDFAALGYNTSNKGVGRIAGVEKGWRYVIEGSDPSDAPNWKKRLAASPEYSLTTPTHRSVPGTVVLNSAVSDDGVIGWRAVDFAGTWAVMRSGGASGYTETNNDGTSSYTYGTHGPTIRDISTLTNNRFRNLITIGPQKVGDVFEISRAGADSGGPWELRVRNGTDTVIAALTVNQWARCVWTGTAWALLSRGSLT